MAKKRASRAKAKPAPAADLQPVQMACKAQGKCPPGCRPMSVRTADGEQFGTVYATDATDAIAQFRVSAGLVSSTKTCRVEELTNGDSTGDAAG